MVESIAIVEDEPMIRDNYADSLRKQGYDVTTYENRARARAGFRTQLPDLVLLDIGLEDEADGGLELCRELRNQSETLPIIFLTARDSELDSMTGLAVGANEYISKDISLPFLLARIKALLKLVSSLKNIDRKENLMQCGDFVLNMDRFSIKWKNERVELTLTEFWIVHSLAERPGHVKSRSQLMQDASIYVSDDTINSHIKRIRKKFKSLDPEFTCIDTVHGAGYRWLDK